MSIYTYDKRVSMPPTVSAGPDRRIGVAVTLSRPHAAFGNALYSDIEITFPVLWPQALIDCVPEEAWSDAVACHLRLCIDQIDQAIGELAAQRARLAAELEQLIAAGDQPPTTPGA